VALDYDVATAADGTIRAAIDNFDLTFHDVRVRTFDGARLGELGISIAPLLASAGVLGLAIGFGAQRMVEDIIGGLFIQFENAVNVGDVVLAAGITGTVEKLTIRSVGLRDLHGVYHVVPFSAVTTVSNLTKGFGFHVADISIAYREDIDAAKAEMLAAFDDLRADPDLSGKVIGELEWFGVVSLGDSRVVLRARLRTGPGEQWALGRAYNERIKRRFDAAGIQIPFPQLQVWFGAEKDGSATPANLRIDRRAAAVVPRPAAADLPERPVPERDTRIRADSPTDADGDDGGDGGSR
jgi:small-conductance mechanosensitive channel